MIVTPSLQQAPPGATKTFWAMADEQAFATYESLLGKPCVEIGGAYWRAVRPFFYRPLLPFAALSHSNVVPPRTPWWGGYQHAVPAGEPTNSCMNMLLFEDAAGYSVDRLDYNRKRQVRKAQPVFTIRVMSDVEDFKRKAFPVYGSFHQRTGYAYGACRRKRANFDRWAGALFDAPKWIVLGGYRGETLGGISVSLRIRETLLYAMFFCDDESLRLNLSDLMLHTVRAEAAREGSIRQIYAGMSREKNDRFYLLRGCRCVSKPAWLQLNPKIARLARVGAPGIYRRLCGMPAEWSS